jgi:hypothetical protein
MCAAQPTWRAGLRRLPARSTELSRTRRQWAPRRHAGGRPTLLARPDADRPCLVGWAGEHGRGRGDGVPLAGRGRLDQYRPASALTLRSNRRWSRCGQLTSAAHPGTNALNLCGPGHERAPTPTSAFGTNTRHLTSTLHADRHDRVHSDITCAKKQPSVQVNVLPSRECGWTTGPADAAVVRAVVMRVIRARGATRHPHGVDGPRAVSRSPRDRDRARMRHRQIVGGLALPDRDLTAGHLSPPGAPVAQRWAATGPSPPHPGRPRAVVNRGGDWSPGTRPSPWRRCWS